MVFVSLGTQNAFGQPSIPNNQPAPKQPNRRVNIYFHLGSIELPEGYKAYYGKGFTDAWLGWIESSNSKFKINWVAGTVETLFDKQKKEFKWIKTETTTQNTIKFGLIQDKKYDRIVAAIGWIEFTAISNEEKEQNLFMEVIRSYQKEKCDYCRTALFKSRQN